MNGKGKQFVAHGRRVVMAFPGGAGYGVVADRDPEQVKRDLARGYISPEVAARVYGLNAEDIAAVQELVARGEDI
jgi:N-methylhydantoinase B